MRTKQIQAKHPGHKTIPSESQRRQKIQAFIQTTKQYQYNDQDQKTIPS